MKTFIKQDKRVWKTFWAFKPFEDKIKRLTHFSNAANLNLVENELSHSAKELHVQKTDQNLFGLLQRSQSNDIFGIQDVQSYSPMYNVISLHDSPDSRYIPMHEYQFLGRYPLPPNLNEVETQSHWINFNFLRSLDFDNSELEALKTL